MVVLGHTQARVAILSLPERASCNDRTHPLMLSNNSKNAAAGTAQRKMKLQGKLKRLGF